MAVFEQVTGVDQCSARKSIQTELLVSFTSGDVVIAR